MNTMKKSIKLTTVGTLGLVMAFSAGFAHAAIADIDGQITLDSALNPKATTNANANVNASGSLKVRAVSGAKANGSSSATSSTSYASTSEHSRGNGKGSMSSSSKPYANASSSAHSNASVNAESHRSDVARFVQNMLSLADNQQSGLGSRVRVIAQAQNDSSSTTVKAMGEVENKGSLRKFLFGPGYGNLKDIKAESDRMAERASELRVLASQSTDAQVQASLNAQADALVQAQAHLDAFIESHKNFSLFGWLVRIFS